MRVAPINAHERAVQAATLNDYATYPTRIQFGLMKEEETKNSGVLHIASHRLLDVVGRSHPEGILSKRLASVDRMQPCQTCLQDVHNCKGHFGDIAAPPGLLWGLARPCDAFLILFF
jgi:hypothetical protein